jgi:lipopolysaccharide export system permease protein
VRLAKLTILDRYFLGKILPTMMLTLMVAAVILMLDKLLTLLNLTIGSGVSALIAFKMMFTMVPNYLRLVLPLGLFLGVLFAFRGLSMNSEFHVMQSSGISLGRMVRAPIGISIVGLFISFGLVGYGEPMGRYIYNLLYFDVTNGVIESGIGEGIFVKIPGGYTVRVEQSKMEGRKLYGVFVARDDNNGHIETFTAKQGTLATLENGNIVLRLVEGQRVEWTVDQPSKRVVSFDVFDLPFDLSSILRFRDRGGDERELTLPELLRMYIIGLRSPWDQGGVILPADLPEMAKTVRFSAIAAETNSRIAYAFSILLMPFFGAPLGITSPRSGRYAGPTVGLLGILAYQKTLEFTTKGAAAGKIPAEISIWGVFIVFAVLTWLLFQKTANATGVTPFNKFEEGLLSVMRSISLRLTHKRGPAPA